MTGGVIAIVPARAGSKGIIGKNLRLVSGKPLIQWSVEQACECTRGVITELVVTSDSWEILNAAGRAYTSMRQEGKDTRPILELHERSADLADDEASTETVMRDVFRNACLSRRFPEYVVLLQPTSPIRQPGEIESALKRIRESGADSLFSARRVEGFIWFDRDNGWEPCYDPVRREMRQTAQSKLEENGSIYIFKPWVLEQFNSRLGGKVVAHEMHPLDSFQVDEPADLELMEQLIPLRMPQAVCV